MRDVQMTPDPETTHLYLESEGAARLQVVVWVLQRVDRWVRNRHGCDLLRLFAFGLYRLALIFA